MRQISLTLIAVLFLAAPVAAEECCATKLKATQEKVDTLISKWQAASKSLASLSPEEKAGLAQQLASAAQVCPIGSRMGETLGFVREALAASINADAECAAAIKCENLAAAFAARGKLLKALGELTAYASAPTAGGASCEKAKTQVAATAATACAKSETQVAASQTGLCAESAEKLATAVRAESCPLNAAKLVTAAIPSLKCEKTVASLVEQVKGAGCEKSAATLISAAVASCAKSETNTTAASVKACGDNCAEKCCQETQVAAAAKTASCSSSLMATASLLSASWSKAPAEFAAFGDEARAELHSKFAGLMEKNAAVRLFPETVLTLADGLEVLVELETYLLKTVKADGELSKALAGDAGKAVEERCALIREASRIMSQARAILKGAFEPKSAD